jgi:hypothetical protein
MALLVLSKTGLFTCHPKLQIYTHILFYHNTLTEHIFSRWFSYASETRWPVLDPVRENVH